MKKIVALSLLLAFMATNGCSLFKNRKVEKTLEEVTTQSKTDVTKISIDTSLEEQKGISVGKTKNYTEEITYKNNVDMSAIALTANFKLDTSSSMRGDTVVKLVDIDDSRVSVAIFQNKKTNELMAKITSAKRTTQVPFSEITIKRNYAETSDSTDTSKRVQTNTYQKLDSVGKSSSSSVSTTKNVSSKPSATAIVLVLLLVGAVGFLIYRFWDKIKQFKL